jgi:hypothetical protein
MERERKADRLKPVLRNRASALSPGRSSRWFRRWRTASALRRKQRHQNICFHARSDFHERVICNFLQQAVHLRSAHFLMSHFAAAMKDHRLYFVPFAKEPNNLILANLKIMFRGRRTKLDFLELRTFLMFALFVRFFVGLVKIFSVVGDLANRRVSGRRNFHQIQSPLFRKLNRFKRRHHTQLPAILIHHANFTRPNSIVDANSVCLTKTPFRDKPTSKNRACQPRKSLASATSSFQSLPYATFCSGSGWATKYSTTGSPAIR